MKKIPANGIEIKGSTPPPFFDILTPQALEFLASLHRRFDPERTSLLEKRAQRQVKLDEGERPDFLLSTAAIRNDKTWHVAETPADLQKRHVEITGPVERKMMINALNSGADIFMADFEDSLSPAWSNVIEGQINLIDAIKGNISYKSPEGKSYALKETVATLSVRPRGWHLSEKHLQIDNRPISASLFDFGLFFFHNAHALTAKGSAPYLYLPKLESHLEARLWNDVFIFAQDNLKIPQGTIRATVLIETILAVFEMEEILFELREHSAGLNAGRWDYIFSIIKKFHADKHFIFPDRGQISMDVPFMRAYTSLLIDTCRRRGAHAIGGMAAFIPNRKDKQVTEEALKKVKEDKERESKEGFDGTWVAHPDLVSLAKDIFNKSLASNPHQKERLKNEAITSRLLDFTIPGGSLSEAGLRRNINVSLQYLDSWLRGIGAAAIDNLMEDAATAEISRAQLWQWLHSPLGVLKDNRKIDASLYYQISEEEFKKIGSASGHEVGEKSTLTEAKKLLDQLVTGEQFVEFLTIPAYEHLD